jgi:serine/threonine-protein kinase RsbW
MIRKFRIESKIASLHIVEKVVDEATNELGVSQECYGKILVSILEAVNNAILHGNQSDPTKFVDIEISSVNGDMIIKVTDQGKGFNPKMVPDPTIPENLMEINGRGVFLMSRLADKLEYSERGNMVTMTFNLEKN